MSIGTTSVSIAGDEVYKKALKAVAAQNGMAVGELVRKATDATYGDQLEPHIRFFLAQCEDKNPQSTLNIPTEPTHAATR
jgi:hypothetical protein